MKISVVTPVYNAEPFIRKAVESAIQQPEVGEVLLIEDGSADNSLQICTDLEKEYPIVKLLRFPDGKNHGAGAARNVGIKNSKFKYIAFLDADDYYLPGRFRASKRIFENNLNVDGVYEAVGVHFYIEEAKKRWLSRGHGKLTTLSENINSEELFNGLVRLGKGSLHLDGLVVKKSLIVKCGYFNEKLKLHQDSTLIIQMSECGTLVAGRLDSPVATRGIHQSNRILSKVDLIETKCLARQNLFYWGYHKKLRNEKLIALFYNYLMYLILSIKNKKGIKFFDLNKLNVLLIELIKHPFLCFGILFEHFSRKKIQIKKPSV